MMAITSRMAVISLFVALSGFLLSCGKNKNLPLNSSQQVTALPSDFIINGLDWLDVPHLPHQREERINAYSVGNLTITKGGGYMTRCTAFLINADTIMTNHHCVSSSAEAQGAQVEFLYEQNVPHQQREKFRCDDFIDADAELDMALLRCQGKPGLKYGAVQLDEKILRQRERIYVIHQNCDWENDPSCSPYKKYSPGIVTQDISQWIPRVVYDADTLQGSSGSPVFSESSHTVIAINNVGLYHMKRNKVVGEANAGIPMGKILNYLQRFHPNLPLGRLHPQILGKAPRQGEVSKIPPVTPPVTPPVSPPVSVPSDNDQFAPDSRNYYTLNEPENFSHDHLQSAVPLSAPRFPLKMVGNISRAYEKDLYQLDIGRGGSLNIQLDLSSQAGDLDLFLLDRWGRVFYQSKRSGNNSENFEITYMTAGRYFLVVVGHQQASGQYHLKLY